MFWYKRTNNKYFTKYKINGEQIYFSKEVTDILGYEPEEMIGKSAYEYFHPQDLSVISKSHFEINVNDTITTAVYRMRHKDGSYIWVRSFSQNTNSDLISITKRLNLIEVLLHKLF